VKRRKKIQQKGEVQINQEDRGNKKGATHLKGEQIFIKGQNVANKRK